EAVARIVVVLAVTVKAGVAIEEPQDPLEAHRLVADTLQRVERGGAEPVEHAEVVRHVDAGIFGLSDEQRSFGEVGPRLRPGADVREKREVLRAHRASTERACMAQYLRQEAVRPWSARSPLRSVSECDFEGCASQSPPVFVAYHSGPRSNLFCVSRVRPGT